MGTTADKLNGLKNTKQAIKQAIIDKGVAVDEAATFASYATKIGEIQAGGGEKGFLGLTEYPDRQFTSVGNNDWLFNQIKSIDWTDFNKLGVTDMKGMFYSYSGKTLDIANLLTTGVTDMARMFNNCNSLTSLDVSSFDTSKVTSMEYMFNSCQKLTSLDVSHFDTSQVVSIGGMFSYCRSLTSLDVSSFDTSKVTNMYNMFYSCQKLTSLDVSSFDTSKVTSMNGMFYYCQNLTSLDLSHFDTSKVTSMYDIFFGCNNLTTITFGNNWGSNLDLKTFDISYSPLTHNSVLDLFNKLSTRNNVPVVKIKGTSYDLMTPEEIAIAQNKGWTVTKV